MNKNYTNSFAFEFSRIKEQLLRAWININIIHVIIFFILYNNFILKWSLKGIISYIYIHCQEETRASGELFFPVSRQVQINLMFHDMDVYCVDAAMSCMQKIYSYSQKG